MVDDLFTGVDYLRAVLDAFPSPVLIIGQSMVIHDANAAAKEFMGDRPSASLKRLCGKLLGCIHERQAPGGCGTGEFCHNCALRQSVNRVFGGDATYRRMSEMLLEIDGQVNHIWIMVTASPLNFQNVGLVILTIEDVTELAELRKIFPICMHCKKIRDGDSYWQHVEEYLNTYTGVRFSHGICPDCLKIHYPEYTGDIVDKGGSGDA